MAPTKKSKKSSKESRKFFSYTHESLQQAINAVQQNGLSKKKAAQQFGVPRSTLVRKLTGKVPVERKMGPQTELSAVEENVLVNWILAMARKGFPVHKRNLLTTVQKLVKDTGRNTRYFSDDGLPGRTWFESFLRRHPSIKQRHTEAVSKARAAVTRDRLENWFDEILTYLKEEKLDSILDDPTRIFNGDEAGFKMCPSSGKVLGPAKIVEDFYERVSSEKEQITVMAAFSASGTTVPPMIIFPYKKMPKKIVESVPPAWGLGRSESGWMNSEVFYEYISNHFIPYLKNENIVRPVIFFVDGLKSHLTKYVSELCDSNGIILISLFPNATHILQPADVSVFKPLKSGWTSAVRNWKFDNFPNEVTRYTFGTILSGVFDQYATKQTIINGFRKCGLYPFQKNNVDSKCIPNRNTEVRTDVDTIQRQYNLNENVLSTLEDNIQKDELQIFQDTYSKGKEWHGNVESLNLYKVWATIKNKIDGIPANRNTSSENEDVQSEVEKSDAILPEKENFDAILPEKENFDAILPEKENSEPILPEEEFFAPHTDCLAEKNENSSYISSVPHTSRLWQTPDDVNFMRYEKRVSEGFKVPSPFKKCLIFPKTPEKKAPKRKLTIFPAVVSSKKYREYYEKFEKEKSTPKSKRKMENQHEPKEEILMKKKKLTKTKSGKVSKSKSTKKEESPSILMENDSSSESEMELIYDDEDLDLSEPEDMYVNVGNHVIVRYQGEYYPGLVLKKDDQGAEIKSMQKAGFDWKWPSKDDILYYYNEDVLQIIDEPQLKNNRGLFTVDAMSKYQ